jgi:hypothetical protein
MSTSKKLGRSPDGGGHRKLGRTAGNRNNKKHSRGYAFLHHAVDDHSRLAYSEILDEECKETAAAFWDRAHAFFAEHGVTVRRCLATTDPVIDQSFHGNARRQHCSQEDPPLPSADQREGRAIQPHPQPGMGLRRYLLLRRGPRSDLPELAASLQSASTPHRHQGQDTDRPPTRSQPAREVQLVQPVKHRADDRVESGGTDRRKLLARSLLRPPARFAKECGDGGHGEGTDHEGVQQ